jgi:hypothetical protein
MPPASVISVTVGLLRSGKTSTGKLLAAADKLQFQGGLLRQALAETSVLAMPTS